MLTDGSVEIPDELTMAQMKVKEGTQLVVRVRPGVVLSEKTIDKFNELGDASLP